MTTRRLLLGRGGRLLAVAALLAGVSASGAVITTAHAATTPPYPGSLPDTDSAVTICVVADTSAALPTGCTSQIPDVSGPKQEMVGLQVHVNQTDNLTTQAVSLTWTWPGHATALATRGDQIGKYLTDYLQVMQCWGPAVTSAGSDAKTAANYVAGNPGPARENCEFGGATQNGLTALGPAAPTRYGPAYLDNTPTETVYQSENGQTPEVPFDAVDGTVVPHQIGKTTEGVPVYANEFYDQVTTNEAPGNYTFSDGTGGVQFQVQDKLDARGLGCGAQANGSSSLTPCWLVIVPRGQYRADGKKLADLQQNRFFQSDGAVFASPLASTIWRNRIAVPLQFQPVATACVDGQDTFDTGGSELVSAAMLSWQAKLCASKNVTFNYTPRVDQLSRDSLSVGADSLQFVSQPVPSSDVSTAITYAPVTLSGVSISFVFDKATQDSQTFETAPGKPLDGINLDQRLVAKLLTYSYQFANVYRIDKNASEQDPPRTEYKWLAKNPGWLGADPEFLALNPGLKDLYSGGDPISFVQVELNGSDGARRMWQWITSDPDARAFLAGQPDAKGMNVDPWYITDPAKNATGTAFSTDIDTYPNADPWTGLPRTTTPCGDDQQKLGMIDLRPYASGSAGMASVARNILTVNSLEKWTGGYHCNDGLPPGYFSSRPVGPVIPGFRALMGITDTASANQYGLVNAKLKNAAGKYVGPTTAGITAAADHLVNAGVEGVAQPDLTNTDPDAYPLTMLTYAAVTTNDLPSTACADYATLLQYAAGDGQVSGDDIGQLPAGYVPLPAALKQQTLTAAQTVAACAKDPSSDSGDTTSDTTVDSSSDGGSFDTGSSSDLGSVDDGGSVDTPADAAPGGTSTPPTSLATKQTSSDTPHDPWLLTYLVPIVFLVAVLALLLGPLAGRQWGRRGGTPTGG